MNKIASAGYYNYLHFNVFLWVGQPFDMEKENEFWSQSMGPLKQWFSHCVPRVLAKWARRL
jgi:hypothetical protein